MGWPAVTVSATTGAVLFDLDGTLADTDPLHASAWRHTAEQAFGITFSWPAYQRACLVEGLTPVEFLARLGAREGPADLAAIKDERFQRLIRTELTLNPGVPGLLAALDRHGVPMGIVSSGSRRSVRSFVTLLWPVRPPAVIVCREDTGEQKPSPEPYLLALRRLGRAAAACVAIEDTARGARAAAQAGLRTIRLTGGEVVPRADSTLAVASLTELGWRATDAGVLLFGRDADP